MLFYFCISFLGKKESEFFIYVETVIWLNMFQTYSALSEHFTWSSICTLNEVEVWWVFSSCSAIISNLSATYYVFQVLFTCPHILVAKAGGSEQAFAWHLVSMFCILIFHFPFIYFCVHLFLVLSIILIDPAIGRVQMRSLTSRFKVVTAQMLVRILLVWCRHG